MQLSELPSISARRKRVSKRELFPLPANKEVLAFVSKLMNVFRMNSIYSPVRPTTPSVVPAGISTDTFFKTRGEERLYLIETFLN